MINRHPRSFSVSDIGMNLDLIGSSVSFESSKVDQLSMTRMDDTHVIVTYRERDNVFRTKAVCVEIDNNGIKNIGTPYGLYGDETRIYNACVQQMDSTHAIVVYYRYIDEYGYAECLELNGTTITSGSPVAFNTSERSSAHDIAKMDSSTAFISHVAWPSEYPWVTLVSLSGNTISINSNKRVTASDNINWTSITPLDSDKIIYTYADANPRRLITYLVSKSGTYISIGNSSANLDYINYSAYDFEISSLNSNYALVAGSQSTGGGFVIPVKHQTNNNIDILTNSINEYFYGASTFSSIDKSDSEHCVFTYRNGEDGTTKGRARVAKLSGETVKIGNTLEFSQNRTEYNKIVCLTENLALVAYVDEFNGLDYGKIQLINRY